VTYLRLFAVVLMILGVFALLCLAILTLRAHLYGAPREQLILFGGWAVVGPGLLLVVASFLEWLAGSMARQSRCEGDMRLPVGWHSTYDGVREYDQDGDRFFPDEPGVRE
jgi:hypothetical protein